MTLLERSLGDLARDIPGATRVFHAHKLDFCCGGRHSLAEAAAGRGLDAGAIAAELQRLNDRDSGETDWRGAGTTNLIEHILARYHAVHREQLPELIRLARRVEQVHGARPQCPNGLADALAAMQQELESHMQKEEQVLFPLLGAGADGMGGPVAVMRFEHDQHGEALGRLEALADDFKTPEGACNTWQALCRGLRQFREDLMQHIHLENNILFEGLAAAGAGTSAPRAAVVATVDPATLRATLAGGAGGGVSPGAGTGAGSPADTGAAQVRSRPVGGCGCGGSGQGSGGCAG